MHDLTPKQKQILDYLKEFIGEHGYAPTLEQIGRRFHLRSGSTVHGHLAKLQEKGWLAKGRNTRGFSLTDKALGVRSRLVPVASEVAPDGALRENAGGPSMIDVPAALAPGEQSFALRIVGSPRPSSGLQDRDFIIARESGNASGHELVIAQVDGRTRLARNAASAEDGTLKDNGSNKRMAARAVVTGMLRTYERSQD